MDGTDWIERIMSSKLLTESGVNIVKEMQHKYRLLMD